MKIDRAPTIGDLQKRALKRIPDFARAFLESGTDEDVCAIRNRTIFRSLKLNPIYLSSKSGVSTEISILGARYSYPFGIAPVAMAGLIWPGAERIFLAAAAKHGHPFCLSTISSLSIEEAARLDSGNLWFQLYGMRSKDIQADILSRCWAAGVQNLVVTIDVPTHARREAMVRAGIGMPIKLGRRLLGAAAVKPSWSMETLLHGVPHPANLLQYVPSTGGRGPSQRSAHEFLSTEFGQPTDAADLREIRRLWPGKLIVKGVMTGIDARAAVEVGADALWLSNHGGRQLDQARHPLEAIEDVKRCVGVKPLIVDSGIRSGGDIALALSAGADFTFLGRAYLYGLAAGKRGAQRVSAILGDQLRNVMRQIGCEHPSEIAKHAVVGGAAAHGRIASETWLVADQHRPDSMSPALPRQNGHQNDRRCEMPASR